MPAQSWLWPDHNIGKRESRKLREEHNEVVEEHAELLAAAQFYVANCPQRSRFNHDRDCDGPLCRMFRNAIAKATTPH
jgi:hypothetical protein